ncbi:MAG: preprotein translocase subunit YajC [Opitutales bacterium]|nr:preprotein translocase subunit YajC [Opitutales bacterium]
MNIFENIVMFAQEAVVSATETSAAVDEAQAGVPGGPMSNILIWVLLFAGLWFLMFMPQRKRAKEQKKMQDSLAVGDQVVTAGGIYGKIVSIDEKTATLEVAQGRITFVRQQIVGKL